uniref:BPTI/Kunitz inhibitor domain-containing protein n=1 Tax=Pseudonaja textilis TaxID=8673 RepID=A0A670ZRD7_PSETE
RISPGSRLTHSPWLMLLPMSLPVCEYSDGAPEPEPTQTPFSHSLAVRSDQCQLPLQQESCKKKLQRYHYDGDKKKCVLFMGCGDNRNNFPTRELCEKAYASPLCNRILLLHLFLP